MSTIRLLILSQKLLHRWPTLQSLSVESTRPAGHMAGRWGTTGLGPDPKDTWQEVTLLNMGGKEWTVETEAKNAVSSSFHIKGNLRMEKEAVPPFPNIFSSSEVKTHKFYTSQEIRRSSVLTDHAIEKYSLLSFSFEKLKAE